MAAEKAAEKDVMLVAYLAYVKVGALAAPLGNEMAALRADETDILKDVTSDLKA